MCKTAFVTNECGKRTARAISFLWLFEWKTHWRGIC